jgi:3'-phosphoadenosine 5'-phosphosulfate sulfotransferase (PAPS reductase)/FAD synthetase
MNNGKRVMLLSITQPALKSTPTPKEIKVIKLNHSLAFLRTKQFVTALSDLTNLSSIDKLPGKALFRTAQALYHLERYRECCKVLKTLRLEYPNNPTAKRELTRSITRLVEQERKV